MCEEMKWNSRPMVRAKICHFTSHTQYLKMVFNFQWKCFQFRDHITTNNKHDYLEKNAAHHYHFHVSCVMFLWIKNYRCWFFVLIFGGVFSVMYPNIIDNGLYKLSYIYVYISFRVISDRVTTHESSVLILHRHKSNLLRQVSKI